MLAALAIIVVSTSPTHINDTADTCVNAELEKNYSLSTDVAGLSRTNRTRCDPVSLDLPIINSPFVGREIEMNRIIQQMSVAHIININGAPGFGKSLLAIRIGYEMVLRDSTVRYVDAADKFFGSKVFDVESTSTKSSTHSDKQEQTKQARVNSKSLSPCTHRGQSAVMIKKTEWMEESTDAVVKDLLTWSEKVQCPTVLILDNCDDLISHDMAREKLAQLMNQMLKNSKNQLHIIVTSRQQLYILDDFESLTIKELNKEGSVKLLQLLAPNISANHSEIVSSLVEGCPLALKVVGMLLHKQEDTLSEILQEQLLKHPIKVLDKVSIQKDRFGAIMDVVYEQLGYNVKKCGHYVSLFPGSFSHQIGSKIIRDHCLHTFVEQSLLDEYYVGGSDSHHHTRYKMHRLIREYFREKGGLNNIAIQDLQRYFKDRYCHHFINYVLNLTSVDEISEEQLYLYSLETHNIHHLLNLLLSKTVHTPKELTILAYAVGENLLPVNSVRSKFPQMMGAIVDICHHKSMKHRKCAQLFSLIIEQLYLECKCNNTYDYVVQIFSSPCKDLFPCSTLAEIYNQPAILEQLGQQEQIFLSCLKQYHCATLIMTFATSLTTHVHWPAILSGIYDLCWIIHVVTVQNLSVFHGYHKFYLLAPLLHMLICFYYFLHEERMVWLSNYFPLFFLHLKKLIIYVVFTPYNIYSGSTHRFVAVYNRTLELHTPKHCANCLPLFVLIMIANIIFDVFIFWRFVPCCF
jgi:archaellum biogenesis ATPase FlaH